MKPFWPQIRMLFIINETYRYSSRTLVSYTASRACRKCSQMGHLAKACPIGTHLTIPLLTLAEIPNQANQHSAYGSDTDSNEGTKSLATANNIYRRQAHQTIARLCGIQCIPGFCKKPASAGNVQRMGRIINLMNDHNRPHASQEDISMLGELDTSLLA